MKILLLNLARFGDLLQGQAAIRDLSVQGHEVALVCLENFTGAASLLSGLSRVFPLPGSGLLPARPEEGGHTLPDNMGCAWHKRLALLGAWKKELEAAFLPDIVCNLTPSIAPRLLARYLAGDKPCSGFFVDIHGYGEDGNPWAAFLKGASLERGASPFNIVDIFRKCAAVDLGRSFSPGQAFLAPPPTDAVQNAGQRLKAEAPAGTVNYVALQLGASDSARQWPVEFFAALGDRLWHDQGVCPVILGTEAEKRLAGEYAELVRSPFINMCGRTRLEELAALLCCCHMLVTNDTGTMHLAAGLDLPILSIFLATAQPFDTGPYRENCLCLEPDLPCHPCAFRVGCSHDLACRRVIAPELVAELALAFLCKGEWTVPASATGARIWLSRLDEHGFMDLVSLSGHGHETRTVWLRLLRAHLRPFLNEDPNVDTQCVDCPALPKVERNRLKEQLETAIKLTHVLLEQGRVLLDRPIPLMRERFLSNWDRIRIHLKSEASFAPLAMLWTQTTQEQDEDFGVTLRRIERFGACLRGLSRSLDEAEK